MESYNKLFKCLKNDDLILTPNKRLIGFLHKSYASYQQALKKNVWSTLNILQLKTWITRQWEQQLIQKKTTLPYRLLSKNQERVLWQSLIKKSATDFLMSEQMAKTAQQAWQLQHLWQLDNTSSSFSQTHELRSWKSWVENFISFSHNHACIDFSRATTLVSELFRKKHLKPARRIFLVGFDEINPQVKTLFQSLEQSGTQISMFTASDPQPCARRLTFDNTETELQSMARWAYQSWQAGKKNIVCAVPSLMEIREHVVTDFMETFTDLHPRKLDPLPFNIAAGKKLSEFSIIQSALSLLQLKPMNPFSKISLLIRSPYLAYAQQEQSQRAQLDIYCRRHCENTLSLEQLIARSREQYCPHLSHLIQRLIPLIHQTSPQYPSQWVSNFAQKLHVCAWPGQRPLSSEEFQLIERWSELLNEFSGLDFILGKISDEEALQHLEQLATESLFQAKTLHDPPIHVLGLLDTAGLCVDNLWVMGLDDKSWPAAAHPNPFIPYALQRRYALPHSSNERESYFSSLITQRLLKSARTIVLSHAAQTHEQTLRPSTLIAALPAIEIKDLALPESTSMIKLIWTTRWWEYYIDDTAPILQTHEEATKTSQLFKAQAACPFQAFAQFRLQAQFDPLPQAGLNPRDRGTLLHQVIETLWSNLGDQATLLKQSPQTLQTLIQQAIATNMKKFSQQRPITFQSQFITIESERLQQLLNQLIEFDKKRPPFHQVIHEQQQNFSVAKLAFNLRIDRIDTLADGSTLLIDYKTGKPTKNSAKLNWFDERLAEPQLPLYCLSHPNAKGFAIIYIRSNTLEAQGFSETENGLVQVFSGKKDKNLPQTLKELRTFWQQELEKLAYQFQQGVAKVDPKQGATTCRDCHLQLFCRINHRTKTPADEKLH